jgi:hypothetical protein
LNANKNHKNDIKEKTKKKKKQQQRKSKMGRPGLPIPRARVCGALMANLVGVYFY